jgi:long-chain fatty acid transport protein
MESRSLTFSMAGQVQGQCGNAASAEMLTKFEIHFLVVACSVPHNQSWGRSSMGGQEKSARQLDAAAGQLHHFPGERVHSDLVKLCRCQLIFRHCDRPTGKIFHIGRQTLLEKRPFGWFAVCLQVKTAVKTKIAVFVIAAALLLVATASVCALGIRIPNQDAEANARGNAFVATANNPSAIYYNPAGITQLKGHTLHGGVLNHIGLNYEYDSAGGTQADAEFEVLSVPQIYYTFTPENGPCSFGIGLYAPFGLGLQWPEDSGFRSLAIESRLTFITLNPVIAYKLSPNLSVGFGPSLSYSKVELRQGIGLLPGDEFRYEGDDFGVGFNAGILWQPHERWSFGANYRGGTDLNYRGKSELRPFTAPVGSRAEVKFPLSLSGGVSFRPTPKWNIEVAADWTDWTCVDNLVIENANTLAGGADFTLPLKWRASWFYHFGLTRYFEKGYFASVGYYFSENTTSERHFSPYVPDTDVHVASIGAGYKGQRWHWALAAQLFMGMEREVNDHQTTSLIGETANGKYNLLAPAVTFSLGRRF